MGRFVPDADTRLGGSGRDFPTTLWSSVLQPEAESVRRSSLEHLARRYWKPIYTYIRCHPVGNSNGGCTL